MSLKKIIRRIVLKCLQLINADIPMVHHYTGDKMKVHSFAHKGYWYHGRKREEPTMKSFQKLITANDFVIEVGGHIGYMSLFFSKLANNGKVIVFEPGVNNLPYLEKNVRNNKNIRIVKKGVGNENGSKKFYIESLTGQNNSFVKDFEGLINNKKSAGVDFAYKEVTVDIIKLDDFISQENYDVPDFIKIDVEGFEYNVLLGMEQILSSGKTSLMVEVQGNFKEIYDLMKRYNYTIYSDELILLPDYYSFMHSRLNRFFLPPKKSYA